MQPPGAVGAAVPPDPQAAKSAVKAPAIILIIIAVFGILLGIVGMFLPQAMAQFVEQMPNNPDMEKLREALQQQNQAVTIGQNLLLVVLSAVVLFGSIQMLKLRAYGLAMAAAIISIVPCVGSCCCLGMPFGIWALVVLLRPQVKGAFQ